MSAEEFNHSGAGLYGYFEIRFGEHAEGQYYEVVKILNIGFHRY